MSDLERENERLTAELDLYRERVKQRDGLLRVMTGLLQEAAPRLPFALVQQINSIVTLTEQFLAMPAQALSGGTTDDARRN